MGQICLLRLNLNRQAGSDLWKTFFFTSTCHNILISRANYMFSCSTYGSTTQSMRSNDAVANLHCVNTKWVIWKRCWHVDPVIKPNAFTYSVNAPVQCNVHPYIHSLFQKAKRETQAIWLWLGPWRNHYPHDLKLLIPSLTPPSVSHFSHSLDKFIYMKDHSHWHGPAGKWQSNQRFHAILPFLCAHAVHGLW